MLKWKNRVIILVMKQKVFLFTLILAYFLGVGLLMARPQYINADTEVLAVKAEATQEVHFSKLTNAVDPNQVFGLVNKERAARGIAPLVANEKLGAVAASRATDMAKRQYYAHKNPDGKYFYDLLPDYGVSADYSCENLDLVFVPNSQTFVDEWLASTKGHKECMLSSNVKAAGYAAVKMTYLDYRGHATPAYLVVAIHSTQLN